MTLSRSTARVFTGTLSHLMVNEVMAAAQLTHTLRERERDTPIRISAEVLKTLGPLSEGPIALYGELTDGVLVVLGPDLRRRTLAAARPRGEMGPPAPQSVEGLLSDVTGHYAKATNAPYLKGRLVVDGSETTAILRGDLVRTLGPALQDGPVSLRGVRVGETFEVLGLVETPQAAKRALSREQKDARNARARQRRAKKKAWASI